ncbi:MAG TPA: hypothetical protein VK644_15315 [Chitinophagaceae bacterium]|nr:hypothetical protein [Chitinophagaceae bacterium]
MSQFISLQEAIQMTTVYRNEKENILAPAYQRKNILCRSESFGRDVFDSLLAQPDCQGIRVYYGMDDALKVHAIFVGYDSKDADILPSSAPGDSGPPSTGIGESGKRCPDDCPPPSDLNP